MFALGMAMCTLILCVFVLYPLISIYLKELYLGELIGLGIILVGIANFCFVYVMKYFLVPLYHQIDVGCDRLPSGVNAKIVKKEGKIVDFYCEYYDPKTHNCIHPTAGQDNSCWVVRPGKFGGHIINIT